MIFERLWRSCGQGRWRRQIAGWLMMKASFDWLEISLWSVVSWCIAVIVITIHDVMSGCLITIWGGNTLSSKAVRLCSLYVPFLVGRTCPKFPWDINNRHLHEGVAGSSWGYSHARTINDLKEEAQHLGLCQSSTQQNTGGFGMARGLLFNITTTMRWMHMAYGG